MAKRIERLAAGLLRPVRGLLLCPLLAACGGEEPVDAAGGKALLARVEAEQYREWQRAPGWESRLPSIGGGHGGQLDIYVNEEVASALAGDGPMTPLPLGSTIVKDVWNQSSLHAIAIMDKRPGGWYWAEFNGNGEVSAAGHPDGCITCHQRGVDFVRAFVLP